MLSSKMFSAICLPVALVVSACGSSEAPRIADYVIVSETQTGPAVSASLMETALVATAGDVLYLSVLGMTAEGVGVPPPSGLKVNWSGAPLAVVGDPDAKIPSAGADPAAMFVDNPARFVDLGADAVLGIVAPGTRDRELRLTATISGVEGDPQEISGVLDVSGMPSGNAETGRDVFSKNCGSCHASTGSGTAGASSVDAEALAADRRWSPALFAIGVRVGMDPACAPLEGAMPIWLNKTTANGFPLSTQDFADMYAFLESTRAVVAESNQRKR